MSILSEMLRPEQTGWGLSSDGLTGSGSLCIELVSDLWLSLQFHGQVPIWDQSWLLWLALFGHRFPSLDTLQVFSRTYPQRRLTPQSSAGP